MTEGGGVILVFFILWVICNHIDDKRNEKRAEHHARMMRHRQEPVEPPADPPDFTKDPPWVDREWFKR